MQLELRPWLHPIWAACTACEAMAGGCEAAARGWHALGAAPAGALVVLWLARSVRLNDSACKDDEKSEYMGPWHATSLHGSLACQADHP